MALHPKTDVQRATNSRGEPAHERRGYEQTDAPAGLVTAGVAVFMSLVLIGLAVAAGTIEWLDARHGLVMRSPPAPIFARASLPPLLADPVQHRREVEAEARSHLDPAKIQAAMIQLEQQKEAGKR